MIELHMLYNKYASIGLHVFRMTKANCVLSTTTIEKEIIVQYIFIIIIDLSNVWELPN
jgi:hypothetical protein